MQENTNMETMTARAENLINAIAGSIMATAETAAEKIELSAKVASIRQKMEANQYVLESIDAQKRAVIEKRDNSRGSLKAAFNRQIKILETQEIAILKLMGVGDFEAQHALGS